MGVLLMLMTIGGVIAAAILFVVAVYTGKVWLRHFVLGGVGVWSAFYIFMLLAFSLTSEEQTLALNEPKQYCGFYFDCHLHTAVTGVRTAKSIGDQTANGTFYIVAVKVFSDAKRATLGMSTVDAHVVDVNGQKYTRDIPAENALTPQSDFDKRIGPRESFVREIVFDFPADISDPRLDLSEGWAIDRVIESVLIGDEDSLFHGRQYFAIREQTETAGVK